MANDAYQLIIGANLAGQPVENVLHFDSGVEASPNPEDVNQLLQDAWDADFETPFLACLPDNYTVIGYKIRRVNNGGGPALVTIAAAATTGARGADAEDSAIGPCLISSFNNGVNWRTGKIFLPGVAAGDVVNNVIQAALIAAINTLIVEIEGPHVQGGSTFQYAVFAKQGGFATKAPFIPANTSLSVKLGVQGGRLKPIF